MAWIYSVATRDFSKFSKKKRKCWVKERERKKETSQKKIAPDCILKKTNKKKKKIKTAKAVVLFFSLKGVLVIPPKVHCHEGSALRVHKIDDFFLGYSVRTVICTKGTLFTRGLCYFKSTFYYTKKRFQGTFLLL